MKSHNTCDTFRIGKRNHGNRKNHNRGYNNAFLIAAVIFVLMLYAALSCSDLPSFTDIEQLDDRTPPVFTFEYPSEGDIYGDIVRVKGKVVDTEESGNQAERMKMVVYSVNGNYPEIPIQINDKGAFLVSFSTYHFDGNIKILFKATDVSGNTGKKTLSLAEGPAPTPEPEPTSASTSVPDATPEPAETPVPSVSPQPVPTKYPAGYVWYEPEEITVSVGSEFSTEIHVNTGTQNLAAYGFKLQYKFSIVEVDSSAAYNGIDTGPCGFISAVNCNTVGLISISGFDTRGTPPGTDLHFLTAYWKARGTGSTILSISVDTLVDASTETIGNPTGIGCTVIVE